MPIFFFSSLKKKYTKSFPHVSNDSRPDCRPQERKRRARTMVAKRPRHGGFAAMIQAKLGRHPDFAWMIQKAKNNLFFYLHRIC
jgi:hypothetical protein